MTLPEEFEFIPVRVYSSPLILGVVFKRWREIARATPELWAAIWVHASENTSFQLLASGALPSVAQ